MGSFWARTSLNSVEALESSNSRKAKKLPISGAATYSNSSSKQLLELQGKDGCLLELPQLTISMQNAKIP